MWNLGDFKILDSIVGDFNNLLLRVKELQTYESTVELIITELSGKAYRGILLEYIEGKSLVLLLCGNQQSRNICFLRMINISSIEIINTHLHMKLLSGKTVLEKKTTGDNMGLKEKRAAKNFQENKFKDLKEEIVEILGTSLEVEVNWDTLMVKDYSHMYEEAWTKVYFLPVLEAFKEMCQDALTKEALINGLKKISIENSNDNFSAKNWVFFEGEKLLLNHSPITNVDDIDERKKRLVDVLEDGL